MSPNPPPTKWLVASAWLATNCFAFNMSSLGLYSYWVIPAALVATCFHHGFLVRYLGRHPGQAIPRKYIYTFPIVILAWAAGAGVSLWIGAFTAYYHDTIEFDVGMGVPVTTLIGGALSVIETGIVIEVWRRCAKLKTNGMADALPLSSVDNLERQVSRTQTPNRSR
ncbi:hypothetical protein B0J17DRAFT_719702 [Rhizoctonia solani]|nr:hypothetical protein B0J17DRAFT_719702 [Rhizoctonia solani]